MECCATTRNSSRPIVTCANDCSGFLGSRAKSPSSTELRQTVEGVADVAKCDEAEDRKTNEESEDPEQERGVPYLGAVVLDALRLLLLLHRLRDGGEELLVRLGLAEPLGRSSVPSIWPSAESIFRSRIAWRMTSAA